MKLIKTVEQSARNRRQTSGRLFLKMRLRRGIEILPNVFTLANAFFGFCSLVFTLHNDLILAAHFVLLGALMDGLDGRIARLARVTSELGMQLDSLCDAISFCLAPAFLMYAWRMHTLGVFGLAICAIFFMAGVLRLAKFNITHDQQTIDFLGTPTPIAGCFLICLLLNYKLINTSSELFTILLSTVMLVLAFLMISSIPFPTFKQLRRNTYTAVAIGSGIIAITFGFVRFLLILFILYFVFSIEEYLRKKYLARFF